MNFRLRNNLTSLKKERNFILLFLFILLCNTNNYANSTFTRDTIPTPKIFSDLKTSLQKVFASKNKDTLQIVQKIITRTDTLPQLKKEISNDTIRDILKKSVAQKHWTIVNTPGITVTQTSFLNWSSGGNNSLAGITSFKGKYHYKKGQLLWNNDVDLRYGLSRENGDEYSQKTEDIIKLKSTFGYKTSVTSKWYYSGNFSLTSQFAKGYKDKERLKLISNFFAPAKLRLGLGSTYSDEKNKLKINLSPLTNQITFVLDQELADKGAFGVDKGKNINTEIGPLIGIEYETKLMKNINLELKSTFYSDYLNNFGNIDTDIEMNINMKVNKYINSSINTHLLYDDDTKIDENDGTQSGARIQLKQIIGIGISYAF